jgi:UDP-glucose 4-epimerase
MKVLVSGGLGYIGSHTVVELYKHGHQVIIIDSLFNSSISVLKQLNEITKKDVPFFQLDIKNLEKLKKGC